MILVKAIQVFKYEYAPTKAEFRLKIDTKHTISRPISNLYKDNNIKNLERLETIIRGIDESNEDGILGYIDHQYFRKLELGGGEHTYEDNWQEFFFFISSKYNILIIGGGNDNIRLAARDVLVEFLSNDISFLSTILIKTKPMLILVNKIKKQGPMNGEDYKNIMTDAVWKYPKKDQHEGAKRDETNMHRDERDPKCLSKYSTFDTNTNDSNAFDVIMMIYRCNGVLNNEAKKGHFLQMFEESRFVCTSDPRANHWIIFVLETCKKALNLREHGLV